MNYPLISEYIEAIKSAEDNFEELSYLRPVLGDDGLPVMTSGNFAVVFKMKDEQSGKFYAVKCFTKEQEGRAEAYHEITKELKDVLSPYLTSVRYLDKELFVDTDQTAETEFPVLLMDWVEGKTLDKYLRENLNDKYALEMLAYRFCQLAQWLIPQPFAHGDLKPDNIVVREDGTLVLVDYDGMYVPAMKGQKARELGSPDFRHPQRTENDFDEHIDDFSCIIILLSLKAISIEPQLLREYHYTEGLLFSQEDYNNINHSSISRKLSKHPSQEIQTLYYLFIDCFNRKLLKTKRIVDISNKSKERELIPDRVNEFLMLALLIVYLSALIICPFYLRSNLGWTVIRISFLVLLFGTICYLIINLLDYLRPFKKYIISSSFISLMSTLGMLLVFIPILLMADIFVELLNELYLPRYDGEWYETTAIWGIWYFSFLINSGIAFYGHGNDIKTLRRRYLRTKKEIDEDNRIKEYHKIENERRNKEKERIRKEAEKREIEHASDLPF